jgi:mRNA-degrading endonuclease RelE of RelBE toxin-antitoxin system
LGYSVVYHARAQKTLHKLDRSAARRIVDYRALCEVRDAELVILALEIGH